MNEETTNIITNSMAFENDLPVETAAKVVEWLDNEGLIDYSIVRETYGAIAA